MTPAAGYTAATNAALPAYTAFRYAQYAVSPEWNEDRGLELLLLFAAQFPLCMLGAVFAGVSYVEGPTWRRVLIYVVVVALLGALTGAAKVVWESDLAPIVGWAIAMQLALLVLVGQQPELAVKRIEAVTTDAVNLTLLTTYAALVAIAAGIAFLEFTGGIHAEHHPVDVTWSDLAWFGAAYFALRAWSAAYVHTPAFDVRQRGYFDRPWIDRVARLWKSARAADAHTGN